MVQNFFARTAAGSMFWTAPNNFCLFRVSDLVRLVSASHSSGVSISGVYDSSDKSGVLALTPVNQCTKTVLKSVVTTLYYYASICIWCSLLLITDIVIMCNNDVIMLMYFCVFLPIFDLCTKCRKNGSTEHASTDQVCACVFGEVYNT